MNSFGLLRTNTGLTTNVKLMVDSNYRLSLESIDTNQVLSSDKYKKMEFNKTNFYDELVPFFFKDTPPDIAYDIKFEDDVETMSDKFQYQYDEIYQYGARNIINNKNYLEEYEYFAPLYIKGNKLPKKFIIFRVDGPGISILSRENFKFNIINNFKTVKIFDLTTESDLGIWLDRNFVKNEYFPQTPLEMDFRNLEFCKWNGIDYSTGGYTSKSLFIDDILDEEKEIYELDKFIFDNYKNQKIIFPNIINFSFLFDDTPSTPEAYRKWSINRYYGFYIQDMEKMFTLSPYEPPQLKADVQIIEGNFLYSPTSEDPFVSGYGFGTPFYVEYLGDYFKVEVIKSPIGTSLQQVNNNGFVSEEYVEVFINTYKIICDINLEGKESLLNNNTGYIDEENRLVNYDGNFLEIENFSDADVWLIEIDGVYHNIIKDQSVFKLKTDYSFIFNQTDYQYTRAGVTKKVNFFTNFSNSPKKFSIYRLNFSDIKDFDDRIIDTEYSKYEYEKLDELTNTDETKMYFENIESNSNPKELDDFKYQNKVVNIPVSSEYTANYETFKVENNRLTDLWRRNPIYTRWCYQNSLSANDWPYLLNNSQIFEDFNRTTNPFDPDPKRIERNLDYFYTINSSDESYLHHTLHIEQYLYGSIDNNFRFDVSKYLNQATYSSGTYSLNYDFDYFTYFFERKAYFLDSTIQKNVKKYSEFNAGDSSIPNITLLRGIEYRIYDVDAISMDPNFPSDIDTVSLKTSNQFEDYKFSVLVSENKKPFFEQTCHNLQIQKEIIDEKNYINVDPSVGFAFSGTPPSFVSWASTSLEIYNYLGWYLSLPTIEVDSNGLPILDSNNSVILTGNYEVTPYYISDVQIINSGLGSYLEVIFTAPPGSLWGDGSPVAYTNLTSLGPPPDYFYYTNSPNTNVIDNFKLVKFGNRISVPQDYIDRLKVGDYIYVESDCHTGTYSIYENSVAWDLNNTISLIGDPTNSPINFNISFLGGVFYNLTSIVSTIPYNGKKYYTLKDIDNTTKGYCIWQTSYQRWEIYEGFDGISAYTLLAYSVNDLRYPLNTGWDINSATISWDGNIYPLNSISSELVPLVWSLTCSGTWCHDWQSSDNELNWTIIDEWKMDKEYEEGTIVIHDDILYKSNIAIDIDEAQQPIKIINLKQVKSAPWNSTSWDYFNPAGNIFWNPQTTYQQGDFIYREGDYFYCATASGDDFWNPEISKSINGYNYGDKVFYNGKYYVSATSSNNYPPDYTRPWYRVENLQLTPRRHWSVTTSTNPKWKPIELWNPSTSYVLNGEKLVAHNNIIWGSTSSVTIIDSGEEPGSSQLWYRKYSLEPDTDFIYNTGVNPILEMNDKYYFLNSNTTDSTLENGIVIYINKKYKNILINVNINDNTLPNLRNADRDLLYTDLYKKLTAFNFILAINDLSNKYGFSDYLKYVIINEDGTTNTYSKDNNLTNLPYLIRCETPELFEVKVKSLEFSAATSPPDLKPTKKLVNGTIRTIKQINWFNDVKLAYNIKENKFSPKVFENFHGIKNILKDQLWRFSGYYMPLFYDIQLFEKDFEYKKPGNFIFDTNLTDFGLMKERKFRKINRKGSVLKLKDSKESKSIYPMLDEFGYSVEDFFIFRSTWDLQYHSETVENKPVLLLNLSDLQLNISDEEESSIGIPFTSANQNLIL